MDWLVKAGYAERAPDPGDRRAQLIRLTPSGQAAARRIRQAGRKSMQAAWRTGTPRNCTSSPPRFTAYSTTSSPTPPTTNLASQLSADHLIRRGPAGRTGSRDCRPYRSLRARLSLAARTRSAISVRRGRAGTRRHRDRPPVCLARQRLGPALFAAEPHRMALGGGPTYLIAA